MYCNWSFIIFMFHIANELFINVKCNHKSKFIISEAPVFNTETETNRSLSLYESVQKNIMFFVMLINNF